MVQCAILKLNNFGDVHSIEKSFRNNRSNMSIKLLHGYGVSDSNSDDYLKDRTQITLYNSRRLQ